MILVCVPSYGYYTTCVLYKNTKPRATAALNSAREAGGKKVKRKLTICPKSKTSAVQKLFRHTQNVLVIPDTCKYYEA